MTKNIRVLLICTFLAVVTLTVFWRVYNCDFINYDDPVYVTQNDHLQNGITLEGLRWAFTTVYAYNWHPLTWISHMLDVQLFGLQSQWHHLTNLLFHMANTLLLFLVLHRMTKAIWQSAFVAALFALHPLHVESVAWVAERKDVLSAFFWMLTMGAYCLYVERPKLQRYLLVILSFALGLMAKPMLVTLPFVLLLLDFWPLQRFQQQESDQKVRRAPGKPLAAGFRPLLWEKIPLFALTVPPIVVTYMAQYKGGVVASSEEYPLGVRSANAFVSYVTYIGKMIWPTDLAVLYPFPGLLPTWQVLGAIFLLATATIAVIVKAGRIPYAAMGWLWYIGTLVPVIGFVQVGLQARADRYTYLPLIGLFIMVAWGIPDILRKWRHRKEVLLALSTVVLSCLCILTWTQLRYWQNSITLFDHALNVTAGNYLAHNNRGNAYFGLENYRQAVEDYDKAIAINPRYEKAYFNRGNVYALFGKYREAIEDYDKAIAINQKYTKAYDRRRLAYANLRQRPAGE